MHNSAQYIVSSAPLYRKKLPKPSKNPNPKKIHCSAEELLSPQQTVQAEGDCAGQLGLCGATVITNEFMKPSNRAVNSFFNCNDFLGQYASYLRYALCSATLTE